MIPLDDTETTGRFPFWVLVIIALNIYVFYLELTTPNPESIINTFALIPANINFSEFETLTPFITSQFLHGGFLHIISNMWFLWIFGDNVEARTSFFLFPLLYLFCGVAGSIAQIIFMPESTIPMLGASGAIAGILGSYFAWFPNHTIKTLVPLFGFFTIVNVPAFFMLFYWIATQILSGAFSFGTQSDMGGVAYFAHIGGFVAGWILAKLFEPKNLLE